MEFPKEDIEPVNRVISWVRRPNWALIGIVLLGLVLRLWGMDFGLPYTIAPDEPTYLSIALKMLQTGDLNPYWWYYPTLMFYLNVVALGLYFLMGRIMGTFVSSADLVLPEIVTMGVGKTLMPDEFLVARGVTVAFSVGCIVILYLISRRIYSNRLIALFATFALAISPTIVDHSHRIGPDILALFFSMVSFLFIVRIVDAARMSDYLGAGAFAGLAIASKYNVGLILAPLVLGHFLFRGLSGWRRKEILVAATATALVFVIATPYAALDFQAFWEGVRFQVFSYTVEGHAGQEGNALLWYVSYLWSTEGAVILLAAIGGVFYLFGHSKRHLVLVIFPLLYFIFVSQLLTRNARTIMIILPYLYLLAAAFLWEMCNYITGHWHMFRKAAQLGAIIVWLGIYVSPLQQSIVSDYRLTLPDGRDQAREWIQANLPQGTRIAQEGYTPYNDTTRYVVYGTYGVIDKPVEWFAQNGFEYIVASQGIYGRFFLEPDRYADYISKYQAFFSSFSLVKIFTLNDYEIRIYKTDVVIPPNRVAARYGDYGELVELIGYDDIVWEKGEPLKIKLTWRTIGEKPEPFQVLLRLLDQNDSEIAMAREDLFKGNGWRSGMFEGTWSIIPPADLPLGKYRLEVDLIWTRFEYRLPAKTWTGQEISHVVLESLEMAEQ